MAQIYGLHTHNFVNGTEELIAAWKNTMIHRTTSGWFQGPGGGTTASQEVHMASYLDQVYKVNGNDNNRVYNGTIWSEAGNVLGSPISKYIITHPLGRIFLFNITFNGENYASRSWFCDLPADDTITWGLENGADLVQTPDTDAENTTVTAATARFQSRNIKVGDPFVIKTGANAGEYTVQSIDSETQITLSEQVASTVSGSTYWVGRNWVDIFTSDGDIGMGMGFTANEVIYFKKNSVHRYNLVGGDTRMIKNLPGTTSPRSIVNWGGYSWWYHPTGIYRTSGSTGEKVSPGIQDVIDAIPSANQDKVVGWVNQSEDTVNMYLGDVTLRDGETITDCVASFENGSEVMSFRSYGKALTCATQWLKASIPEIYAGGENDDVYQMETGTDLDGTDMPFTYDTKVIFPVDPDTIVDMERVRAYIDNGPDVQIFYKLIYKPTDTEGQWSNDVEWRPLKGTQRGTKSDWYFPEGSRAAGVQLRFAESSNIESFLLEKYRIYFSNSADF